MSEFGDYIKRHPDHASSRKEVGDIYRRLRRGGPGGRIFARLLWRGMKNKETKMHDELWGPLLDA